MADSSELVAQRQQFLLDQLLAERRVLTNEAAEALGVSPDTVRRDLRTLHDQGMLRRVHGGALPISRLPDSYSGRKTLQTAASSILASAIVARLQPGQVVGLDAGTTSVEVATQLPRTMALTIITNNPAVPIALSEHPATQVVLLGGTVDLTWMAAVGPEVVDGWRNYRLDLAVVGVCGFDPIAGATTNSHSEVATKRALMAAAAETIIPVQAEKMGIVAPYLVAEAHKVNTLLVEALVIDEALIDCCSDASIELIPI